MTDEDLFPDKGSFAALDVPAMDCKGQYTRKLLYLLSDFVQKSCVITAEFVSLICPKLFNNMLLSYTVYLTHLPRVCGHSGRE